MKNDGIQLIDKPLQINVFHADFEKAPYNAILKKFLNGASVLSLLQFPSWAKLVSTYPTK